MALTVVVHFFTIIRTQLMSLMPLHCMLLRVRQLSSILSLYTPFLIYGSCMYSYNIRMPFIHSILILFYDLFFTQILR